MAGQIMKSPSGVSNRFQLVERERLHGNIQGVWWGYHTTCLMRAPTTALLWSSGTPYTSGRMTCYGESGMTALLNLSPHWGHHPEWHNIPPEGGRLSVARVQTMASDVRRLLNEGDDLIDWLCRAVKSRQTLLVEGGGSQFTLKARAVEP